MTRLVNFGLGEICDRLSILALKVLYGEVKQLDVTHFRNERNALLTKLMTRETGRWLEHYSDLAAVNAALWRCEDEIRARREAITSEEDEAVRTEHLQAAGQLGLRIATLNDQRAVLIQEINAWVGDKVLEKLT